MSEQTIQQQLEKLSAHLAVRRDAILRKLREAADADPEQTTASSLTRSQFNDHIPEVLQAFERKLRSRPGGQRAAAADHDKQVEEVKHGLHRWQQGYRLQEVMHEWGHLHRVLFEELVAYVTAQPEVAQETMIDAQRELVKLVNEAIGESTGQYARMEREEAEGHMRDLQQVISHLRDLERSRARLIHQAVHDLRGNVQSVSTAAEVLRDSELAPAERDEFIDLVQQGTDAVGTMLRDLMDLARLEAGHERREVSRFDAARLLAEFCSITQPVARARGLFLRTDGPVPLPIEGDADKTRRIVQNLVLNSLKYTETGGVTVSWGEEGTERWWIMIKDTGPGLRSGPGAPMIGALSKATESARETDEKNAEKTGDEPSVLSLPDSDSGALHPHAIQQPGEGIGLSIVKRLCELLDASLEVTSSAASGTVFRIVLPRQYEAAAK